MVPYFPSLGTMAMASVRSVASEDFQHLWILSPQVSLVKVDSLMSIQGYRPVNSWTRSGQVLHPLIANGSNVTITIYG